MISWVASRATVRTICLNSELCTAFSNRPGPSSCSGGGACGGAGCGGWSWGTGAGRGLMAAAVDRLRERGFRSATLWVLRDNERTRQFYERAGWSFDGSTKDDVVAGATVTEVRYRRDL